MNLQQLAAGAISVVNPQVPLTVKVNTGYTVSPDGSRVPSYATYGNVFGQVQPMTWRDIQQTAGLNLQGTRVAIYIDGSINGLVRPSQQGGDLVITPDGRVWLVAQVLEAWPDWCKVAATLQLDGGSA